MVDDIKPGIKIKKLLFTGAGCEDAWVDFADGLSIIYGGSNAGKSFILKSLDFMFGADKLRLPKQGAAYERLLLWMELPSERLISLERNTKGGSVKLFSGFLSPQETSLADSTVLAPNQKGRKSKKPTPSLSEFLLSEIGSKPAQLAKNEAGEKVGFSLRLLSHYLFVGEDEMISERSPIQIPDQRMSSLDKSLFRFLLSGIDDSAVIEVPKAEHLSAARNGKIELLQEFVDEIARQETFPVDQVESELQLASKIVDEIADSVAHVQTQIDVLAIQRRVNSDTRDRSASKTAELRLMKLRFLELRELHRSDLERLEGLDEAALLLSLMRDTDCLVCGASAIHQQKNQVMQESVEQQQIAAEAEAARIRRDLVTLQSTIEELGREIVELDGQTTRLATNVTVLESEIDALRPREHALRKSFEEAIIKKNEFVQRSNNQIRLQEYKNKIQELQLLKIGRQRADGLSISIESFASIDFSKIVKEVLQAWQYPDMGEVYFDGKDQDIVVNGRERNDNGKGVRAILHSAFKVAVLIYCRSRGLPHPGLLVLDSPLLTYRGPLQTKKFGELGEDEKRFQQTDLNEHFYSHLASLSQLGQFIILENQDPPVSIRGQAHIVRFSGEKGDGRQGLFPALST